jgi:hypothetical protein
MIMMKESAMMKDKKVEIEKKRDENNNNNYCLLLFNSTTQFNHEVNNVFMIILRHLHVIYTIYHIFYIIYNVIYAHYNQDWIVTQLRTSLFLVFSQRFEDFYQEFLELIHKYTLLFTKINKDDTLKLRMNSFKREDNCHDVLTSSVIQRRAWVACKLVGKVIRSIMRLGRIS